MSVDFKEIAKKNMFIAHAPKIREICVREDVDVGVGIDMYIAEKGIQRTTEVMEQYQEYKKLCREYTLDGIVKALMGYEVGA